jgi:hypothetical protein
MYRRKIFPPYLKMQALCSIGTFVPMYQASISLKMEVLCTSETSVSNYYIIEEGENKFLRNYKMEPKFWYQCSRLQHP